MNVTLTTSDSREALRFERRLAHPIERVWRAVVLPAELGQWFPAAAYWTPEAGETFEAGGQTGQITELSAPQLIEWTFGGQLFRFELHAEQDDCVLVFTHIFDDGGAAAQTAAGWACYFDRLEPHLSGGNLSEESAHAPIGERHERYAAQFGVDPAPGRMFVAGLDFRDPVLEDGPVLRLERRYDQPIERLWQALTDPAELHQWFPGGLEVGDSEAPRLLTGSWQGEGTLRFELRPEGTGCVLGFSHTFTDRDQAALAGAGWDRCFARLDALLADQMMSEAASLVSWPEVHERLAARWNVDPEIGRTAYAQRPRD
ncbi:SRPBCC domain-containing protein [Arthrobacter sp. H14-L1]|uniref:SRPBCC domain-containing protein n=1 Tax=Arthrobacter sp. H14-L1 TaxID=2996697 RepID=UPI00226DBEF3|nr:SRPBCC domain-containing protein [Arthrobacter sp. H14-L1]MCY0903344.1 SRPBCC domain-containing protein [Arthrobacter sp. H14-L1]